MRLIPLYRRDGSVRAKAMVSDADYARLMEHRWFMVSGYPARQRKGGVVIYMHNAIRPPSAGEQVDHRTRDRLDNRRSNLRLIPSGAQAQNTPARSGGLPQFSPPRRSLHRGVSWHSARGRWRATVSHDGRQHFCGYFDKEDDAADAARRKRREILPFAETQRRG